MRTLLLVVCAAGIVASGCSAQAATPAAFPLPLTPADAPQLTAAPSVSPKPAPPKPASPDVAPVAHSGAVPTAIHIVSIGVHNTDVKKMGLTTKPTATQPAGSIEIPALSTPLVVGWYDGSPTPGDIGPAIMLSHRNGDGQDGGFAKLDQVKVGDLITVDRSDHLTATFRVVETELYPKAGMGAEVRKVYGNTDHPALRLLTCSGVLDKTKHSYQSQRVVFADLISLRR